MDMTTTMLPASVLSIEQQEALTEHYRNYHRIGLGPGEKPRVYSEDEKFRIGKLYDRCREYGYFPAGIDRFGRLYYREIIKSPLQQLFEQVPA